jgi:hypothetical protein
MAGFGAQTAAVALFSVNFDYVPQHFPILLLKFSLRFKKKARF